MQFGINFRPFVSKDVISEFYLGGESTRSQSDITSDFKEGQKMYPGMIITYKVSPLLGIKLNWMTEITHVKEGDYFVDEQRFGPYALWHHQHHFQEIPGGVLMTDIINYAIPMGIFGRMANSILVAKEIQGIFDYREKKVEELFGKYSG